MKTKRKKPTGRRKIRSCPACREVGEFVTELCPKCRQEASKIVKTWQEIDERDERIRTIPRILVEVCQIAELTR